MDNALQHYSLLDFKRAFALPNFFGYTINVIALPVLWYFCDTTSLAAIWMGFLRCLCPIIVAIDNRDVIPSSKGVVHATTFYCIKMAAAEIFLLISCSTPASSPGISAFGRCSSLFST